MDHILWLGMHKSMKTEVSTPHCHCKVVIRKLCQSSSVLKIISGEKNSRVEQNVFSRLEWHKMVLLILFPIEMCIDGGPLFGCLLIHSTSVGILGCY